MKIRNVVAIAVVSLLFAGSVSQAREEASAVTSTAKVAKAHKKVSVKKEKKMKTKAAKKEHWVCPMHDGGESDHAGKCPKCGMDLVLEKNSAAK